MQKNAFFLHFFVFFLAYIKKKQYLCSTIKNNTTNNNSNSNIMTRNFTNANKKFNEARKRYNAADKAQLASRNCRDYDKAKYEMIDAMYDMRRELENMLFSINNTIELESILL